MAEQGDFYQDLRRKIRDWLEQGGKNTKWAEYIMAVPDFFHLLCKLTIDKDVPVREKAKLAAAIAYFVSPIDLIPEAIAGPAGYADDVALAAYVLNSIVNSNPEVVKRHWAGERDVLELIQEILRVADEMVGSGLWTRLKRLGDTGTHPSESMKQPVDLVRFGFLKVGTWLIDSALKSGIRFRLDALEDARAIYAFSVDGEVKYVGVCDSTDTTLKERMKRYQGMAGAGTNERVANLIRNAISEGRLVSILAWRPEQSMEFNGLRVDLIKGLENPFLDALKPEWNIQT